MARSTLYTAVKMKIRRASCRLAGASWHGACILSDVALQTMTASIVGGMLLLATACLMYVVAMALLHVDGIPH